ncbi:hypothetical protein [Microvirga sp. G4-2]|uniref:hypothetical protein n=1 Tax=Microvirga sp. G4-2 TaxID=3434467 RepID=UPI00404500E5
MAYINPKDVQSPKSHWHLFQVVLDKGPGQGAYALGTWDGERRIGFRWNGSDENPIGNPQSRGLPTWTMLDPELHSRVIEIFPADQQPIAKAYFGIK